MKIGIIGTGNIGSVIARKLSAAGNEVSVANSKGVHGVRAIAEEIGATPANTQDAISGADVVILSIPLPAIAKLDQKMFCNIPKGVPVIDTCNYYPGLRDPQITELDAGQVESMWVSCQIGHPVIKAFNMILAQSLAELGRPEGAQDRIAIAVAGDDAQSKSISMAIVNKCGFDPVDSGSLEESWRQQPSTPVYCCDYDAQTSRTALAAAVKGKAQTIRDQLATKMGTLGPNPRHADVIALNRSLNPIGSSAR